MRRLNCLLLYNLYSAIDASTITDHIDSLRKLSCHRVIPMWMYGNLPPVDIESFDVLAIHYSIKVHYDSFMSAAARRRLSNFRGVKILFAQDEYYRVHAMIEAVRKIGFQVVFTVVPPDQVDKVYPAAKLPELRKITTLTGFVPEALCRTRTPVWRHRSVDIGYRGRKLSAWYGVRGQEKYRIASYVKEVAPRFGLSTDITWDEVDRLYGRRWISFVGNCKAVLGAESGGSVLDFDGDIQENVTRYEAEHPGASFDEVSALFLRGRDHAIDFNVISPRIFEAAALRTLMILYEGEYSGRLEPWRHYLPLKKDHQNMAEVVSAFRDEDRALAIIDNAYREVAQSPRNSFAAMVRCFDRTVSEATSPSMLARRSPPSATVMRLVSFRERSLWYSKQYERSLYQDIARHRWLEISSGWAGLRSRPRAAAD
jgi:hypothetical protein